MREREDTYERIAAVIGDDAMRRLALRYPGQRLYVLKHFNDAHPVVHAIGRENADRLSDHFYQEQLELPGQRAKRAEVYRLADGGVLTRDEIAAQVGVARRQVFRWLKERADAANQPDLFAAA